jgi:hypothetical protein
MKTYKPWLALLAVVATVAAISSDQTARGITFGKPDKGRHRNVGAILAMVPQWQAEPWFRMSGTLIAPNLFLTAGHGTSVIEFELAEGFYTIDDLYITFADDPFDQSQYVPVKAVLTHPGFRALVNSLEEHTWTEFPSAGRFAFDDMGVVVLAEPSTIEPATLAPVGLLDELKKAKQLHPDTQFLAVGYGCESTYHPTKPILEPTVRQWAFSEYRGFNESCLTLSMNHTLGNGGTGYGDSGGPRFWIDPADGREYLVAITVNGDPNLVALDVPYRIDTSTAQDFIKAVAEAYPLPDAEDAELP